MALETAEPLEGIDQTGDVTGAPVDADPQLMHPGVVRDAAGGRVRPAQSCVEIAGLLELIRGSSEREMSPFYCIRDDAPQHDAQLVDALPGPSSSFQVGQPFEGTAALRLFSHDLAQ